MFNKKGKLNELNSDSIFLIVGGSQLDKIINRPHIAISRANVSLQFSCSYFFSFFFNELR